MEAEGGKQIVVVQIAGLARRILRFAHEEQEFHAGERFGLIVSAVPRCLSAERWRARGHRQSAIAGETVLADLNRKRKSARR